MALKMIYRTEVTVVNMICRLPPNHWYTKGGLNKKEIQLTECSYDIFHFDI